MKQRLEHIRIPKITDPLGRYWHQPDSSKMILTNKQVVMTREEFAKLKEYSCSIPTGVYEGKMWKRKEGNTWFLVWYGFSDNPEKCAIIHKPITFYERR